MAYIINRKFIFLHIPKTGGSWVNSVLEDSNLDLEKIGYYKHASYDHVVGVLLHKFDRNTLFNKFLRLYRKHDYKYFTVIRNPITWYESLFKYLQMRDEMGFKRPGTVGKHHEWHILSSTNHIATKDFNQFIEEIVSKAPGLATYVFNSYVLNSSCYILKQESLRKDLQVFNEKFDIGIKAELIQESESLNCSPVKKLIWEEENLKKIIKYDCAIFDSYGYSKKLSDYMNK